jgi:serine/threonine-protein kinase
VTLVVSSGPPTVAVPNVGDLTEQEARQALTGAGFEVAIDPECQQPQGNQDPGVVVGQDPAANAQAEPGATVTLTLTCAED